MSMNYAQAVHSPLVMDRVCRWLDRLGFGPDEFQARRGRRPCLFLSTDWARAESAQQIVDALLLSAPDAVGTVWDWPGPAASREGAARSGPTSGASPIHWERPERIAVDEADWYAAVPSAGRRGA